MLKLILSFTIFSTVCCSTKWPYCPHVRPLEGRRHDAFMLSVSGLRPKDVIYGDRWRSSIWSNILASFCGSRLTQQQESFSRSMSRVWVSVEWTFGKVVSIYSYLNFKRSNKILLQPIGNCKYYLVAALAVDKLSYMFIWFPNLHGFWFAPPSLETYLSNVLYFVIAFFHSLWL